jgi:hypothetical protein
MRTAFLAVLAVCCFLGSASNATAADKPARSCICGPECSCPSGACPGNCPVLFTAAPFGDPCPNGRCPAGRPAAVTHATATYSASASCSSETVTRGVREIRPVRALFQNRPRLFHRRR